MSLDAGRFRDALRTIHAGKLSTGDAETIVAISQLAVDADGREDPEEIQMFFTVGKAVFELAGLTETPSPSFDSDEQDDERVRTLAARLSSPAAKELAFAVAYVMAIADVDLAPAEGALVENLRSALAIGEDRAAELAANISAAITPPA
jgi:tellurite resistance protein